jgi:IS5 family transposase
MAETGALKAGKSAKEIRPDELNKAARKDANARLSAIAGNRRPADGWTLKVGGRVRHRPDGAPLPMIAAPAFGCESRIGIHERRRFGVIRESAVAAASAADGRRRRHPAGPRNAGCEVRADGACRSQRDETWPADRMPASRIHRRRPAGGPMPRRLARADAGKSSARAAVQHVFAHRKSRLGLFIRTIRGPAGGRLQTPRGGPARAEAGLALANLAHDLRPPGLPRTPARHGMGPSEIPLEGAHRPRIARIRGRKAVATRRPP